MNGLFVSLSPGSPFFSLFYFSLPLSPCACPVAQSSLADMAAHMNYENVNVAPLTCALCAGALLVFVFSSLQNFFFGKR